MVNAAMKAEAKALASELAAKGMSRELARIDACRRVAARHKIMPGPLLRALVAGESCS